MLWSLHDGLPKASTPPISRTPERYWRNWRELETGALDEKYFIFYAVIKHVVYDIVTWQWISIRGHATMARYALNLPTQLKQEAETWASQQGVSLNQFIRWAVAEKLGALKQQLDDPAFPHITYRR